MNVKELDPVQYEIISHRIFKVIDNARLNVMRVSGSPIVCEGGECLFALYTKEGNAAAAACGLYLHMAGSQGFVKDIIKEQWEVPGINDGDVFYYNEPSIGGIHACDQWAGTPIFLDGEIVAWFGTLTHTPPVGAMEPGGMPPAARSLLHEGLRVQGQKIQERGKWNPATLNLLRRSSEDPAMYMLDVRAKVAGLNLAKKYIIDICQKYGVETFLYVLERMIRHSDELARAKLRDLADGTWRTVVYGDWDGTKYKTWKVCLTTTKEGDSITFDFTGSSPQNVGPLNCMYHGTLGNLFVAIGNQLFWDVPWSYGLMKPVKVITPPGTLVNCDWLKPCGMCPPYPGEAIVSAATLAIAKIYMTSKKYLGDINASWATASHAAMWGGKTQYGYYSLNMLGDHWMSGTGAGIDRDGVDTGGLEMTLESNIADVEMNEMVMPLTYLWRREAKDAASPGKFRGGTGYNYGIMIHNTTEIEMGSMAMGREVETPPGLDGAYPASSSRCVVALGTELGKLLKNGKGPNSADELFSMLKEGEVVEWSVMHRLEEMTEGDFISNENCGSGGGIGDPLDRDPEMTLTDILNDIYSVEFVREIFGVVIKKEGKRYVIDYEATEKKRAEIKDLRKKRGKVYRKGELK